MVPNERKLIARRIAEIVIPPGSGKGLEEGISAILDTKSLAAIAKRAADEIEAEIIKVAADPESPIGSCREAIAGYILGIIKHETH